MNENKLIGITLTIDVVNELLQYLAQQPYSHVFNIIGKIQASEKVYSKEVEQ